MELDWTKLMKSINKCDVHGPYCKRKCIPIPITLDIDKVIHFLEQIKPKLAELENEGMSVFDRDGQEFIVWRDHYKNYDRVDIENDNSLSPFSSEPRIKISVKIVRMDTQ